MKECGFHVMDVGIVLPSEKIYLLILVILCVYVRGKCKDNFPKPPHVV